MSSSKLVSVAIDFGTTYSGYALSFRHDVNDIKTYHWPGGEAKTPTCILFNQNKQFHSFGTQAEDRYSEIAQNGENADWYFFKHFKLLLKNEVSFNGDYFLVIGVVACVCVCVCVCERECV